MPFMIRTLHGSDIGSTHWDSMSGWLDDAQAEILLCDSGGTRKRPALVLIDTPDLPYRDYRHQVLLVRGIT